VARGLWSLPPARIALCAAHLSGMLVLLLAVTQLPGCGFRLAGQATLPFETLYVPTGDYSSFGAEFRRYLESGSKTRLTDRPEQAQAVLEILSERRDMVILSLSSAGRVSEYLLRYRVSFRLTDNAKRELIPASEIALQRDMTYNDADVLGKENEQELLYRDMKNDAVLQLARRLAAARLAS
jgi:LPS-assembly lipoprotein